MLVLLKLVEKNIDRRSFDIRFNKLFFHFIVFAFRYHLKDVIVGKIYFLLVRIKIKHMEIAIIKRETTGSGKSKNVSISHRVDIG